MQKQLDRVAEGIMESPENQAWLKHAGQKGGSTAFVLTTAAYVQDRKGNRMELVFLANGLDSVQRFKLQHNMNAFILWIMKDAAFRESLNGENAELKPERQIR